MECCFFDVFRQTCHIFKMPHHILKRSCFPVSKNGPRVSLIKVGLSPSKKICIIYLMESPFKMMKNAFYFILKALFVLKIFKFLSRLFGHVGKTA